MSHATDRLYFTRRAEQSRVAMGAAAGPDAQLAHRLLMQAYATRAESCLVAQRDGREALAGWTNDGGFTP